MGTGALQLEHFTEGSSCDILPDSGAAGAERREAMNKRVAGLLRVEKLEQVHLM